MTIVNCHRVARESLAWADARQLAHRLPTPLPAEQVPLSAAAGRTLAKPLRAATPLPGFDNAAMDGYAVRGPGPWRLVGRTVAGNTVAVALAPGEAVEIATGAPIPAACDRVVEYEVAERVGDVVSATPSQRYHIRRTGEYVQTGDELLAAGTVLTAPAIGLAASVACDTVAVRRMPRVRTLVTGDEVVLDGSPSPGRVRDAIGPVISVLLTSWGAQPTPARWVSDDPPEELTRAVTDALTDADVVIVGGASSVGPADGLHHTLTVTGATVHIDGIACRPGHPQVLAEIGSRWLVGLPGNPYAALVAAFTLLQPLLAGLAGRPLPVLPRLPLVGDPRADGRRTRIVPVIWAGRTVRVVGDDHPGYLGGAARADALAVVPPTWRPGELVEILHIG